MSTEEYTVPLCKKRFKGVENFLKRIAFNLGNTPSQTEVKIISCIPIDVTDLQQKIIFLEKELEEANAAAKKPVEVEKPEIVNLENTRVSKQSRSRNKSVTDTIVSPENITRDNSKLYHNIDGRMTPRDMEYYYTSAHQVRSGEARNMDHYYNQSVDPYEIDNYSSQPNTPGDMDTYFNTQAKSHNKNYCCHIPKTKKKTKLFKKKYLAPCVFYAQTCSSPFIKSNLTEEASVHEEPDAFNLKYLAAMVSRQYRPEILGDNVSLNTEFSSPICRDVQSRCEGNCHVLSDVCSCCHGPFHNIDEDRAKQNTFQTYMVHQINTGSAFYNTDQYDLVPVKEKPVKSKKDSDRPRKKELRPYIDMKCWPENVRTKYRNQPFNLPTCNDYTARADYTDQRHRRQTRDTSNILDTYGRKMPATFNRTEPVAKICPKRKMCRRERSINIDTSRSCCIDFGNVYPKKHIKKLQKLERSQPIPVTKKNAECLTTAIDNHECQTEMINMEVSSADYNKTEETLNQIKSILQSVLTEVKVSSQIKTHQNKPQKDAVVQKGPSCNNMQASSLMNSITYSPYAMSASPYVTSCSPQVSPNQFCHNPHGGLKCFHNFPVFIQPSVGRNNCSSCYHSSQKRPGLLRQATTTATNTDQVKAHHSRETDKLIKEIYNSMALTVDFPQKDISLNKYNEPIKSLHGFTTPTVLKTEQKKQPRMIKNIIQAVSELFVKKDMIETSDTFESTVDSKATSHEASVRSRAVTSTDTELRTRNDRLEKYVHAKHKQPVEPEVVRKTFRETMAQNANSITESESSSSETETDTTVLHQRRVLKDSSEQLEHKHLQKKGKEGLLTKMFKSVKLFKTKEKPKTLSNWVEKKDDESEDESSSDSDDYQTVYSQKIEKNLRQRSRPHNLPKRKTHSKISYKQTYQRDRSPEKRRSPYMEQENRRYWDEKLMFHNNNPRYYSEQSSSQNPANNPAYYKAYEARTVLVEPSADVPAVEPRSNRASNKGSQPARQTGSRGIAWLKKHKMGIRCGPQWKQLILEG